jgi:hypothetical protein
MNMISTGAFLTETDASDKQGTLVSKLVSAWEKKNSKTARAGGVSLMALSLAACGSSDDDAAAVSYTQAQLDAAKLTAAATATTAVEATAATAATAAATAVATAATAASTLAATEKATAVAAATAAAEEAAATAAAALKVTTDATLATLQTQYDALVAPVTFALTTGSDVPALSVGNDTITGTSATYAAVDTIVDGSSSDNDTLTITATGDITATPSVINIENVVFNIGTALATGDTTFAVDMANIGVTNATFDVTSADSLVAGLSLTNVATGLTVNASSELVTIAMAGAADSDMSLVINADSSISTTGTADDLTISGGTAYDVTLTASTATEDLVVTGLDNTITAAGILGTVTVTSAGDTTLTTANAVGNVTITSGDDTTLTSAAASTGTVTVNSAGVITLTNATAATTVVLNNTGAVAAEDITVTDANSATTVTVTSVGAVTATANSGFAAATSITATVAEDSSISADAVADQVINLNANSSGIALTPEVTYTLLASTVETLNLGGSTAIEVAIDAADISTETVTTTNTSTSALSFTTANAADTTAVAAAVEMRLSADFNGVALTTDNDNVFMLDTEVAQTTGAVTFDHTTNATTTSGNTATIGITDSAATNADVTANVVGLTFTDVNDLTINMGTKTLASTADLTGADLETVTVTGSGAFNLAGNTITGNSAATLSNVSLDASAVTGVVTMALDATAAGVETITTGSAADQITVGAAAASANAFSVTSNGGADRVTMNAATGLTYNGGTGTDTLTIGAGVDLSAQTIVLTSVEQIELVGGGTGTMAASDVSGKTFIIAENGTGTADFAINFDQATVDVSNFGFASSFVSTTDGITLDASSLGITATITGSSMDDDISGSTAADTITANGGIDTIASGGGADVITLTETTAAADIIQFGNASIAGTDLAFGALNGSDTITGLNAGTVDDVLTFDISAFGLGGATEFVGAIGSLLQNSTEEVAILTGVGYATDEAAENAVATRVTSDGLDMVIGYFNTTTKTTHFIHDSDAGVNGTGTTTLVATLSDFTTQAAHDTLDANNIATIT